jgi:hypothetical protein
MWLLQGDWVQLHAICHDGGLCNRWVALERKALAGTAVTESSPMAKVVYGDRPAEWLGAWPGGLLRNELVPRRHRRPAKRRQ